jgi:hypothetical protein
MSRKPDWQRWFAWHPVKINDQWVWLEFVERYIQCMCDHVWIDYRSVLDIRALDSGSFEEASE